jgi:hypothetical protein
MACKANYAAMCKANYAVISQLIILQLTLINHKSVLLFNYNNTKILTGIIKCI